MFKFDLLAETCRLLKGYERSANIIPARDDKKGKDARGFSPELTLS